MQSRLNAHPWHEPMFVPCSSQANVSVSPPRGGHWAVVCSRSFPTSHSPCTWPFCTVQSLWNCSGSLHSLLHRVTSFLPCMHWDTFSLGPSPACSLSQPWTLPLFPFLSLSPWRLCHCILHCILQRGRLKILFSFWFCTSALSSCSLFIVPHTLGFQL